jgi:predicted metalloprotease with PDZ domain
MKTNHYACIVLVFSFLLSASTYPQEKFIVNLNNTSDDLFHITLYPDKLSYENNIYQFASTAPGTYERMDIGRFVKSFTAFDEDGNEITTENISVNQWKLYNPQKIKKIEYSIEDTWDAKIDSDKIYGMSGSNIDTDNVLINGQCLFGYFQGLQSYPIKIKIEYPENWEIGTALKLDNDGFYDAPTYDFVVDSPFLLGNLTVDSLKVGNAEVRVFTYSKTGLIKSNELLKSIKDILQAESKFTNGLPVDYYTFLFHLGDVDAGAWEHSYSSEYVLREEPLTEVNVNNIRSMIAHEFFHIVTPLNIHSEIVEKFNFVKPVMSQHLWLYEGVTEWAANILQLRDSLISLRNYLDIMHKKMVVMQGFNKKISLTELGVHSVEMADQYINIYYKGAVIAGLLDIKLLELSNGTKGLREVINELAKEYGPQRSFDEKSFFDEFVNMTYPEIKDFFENYVEGTEELPIKEYYSELGIDYFASKGFDSSKTSMGIGVGVKNNQFVVLGTSESSANKDNILSGDIIYSFDGEELTFENIKSKFQEYQNRNVGDTVKAVVIRNNEKLELNIILGPSEKKYVFEINSNPTDNQLKLRNAWMKDL